MTNGPQNSNILADILNDPQSGSVRGIDELNKLIFQGGAEKENVLPTSTVKKKPKRAKSKKKGKRKGTHYLTADVFDQLGDVKEDIKKILPKGSKTYATKSRIIESAIKVLLDEYSRKGDDSYLVKVLLKRGKKEIV